MNFLRPGLLWTLTVFLARASELAPLPSIGIAPREVIASWYGQAHEGRKTASGAVFRRQELSAAHRTAKLGTHYLISYKDRVVEVLVNDRGPYAKRCGRYLRDLDLSEAAARSLGLITTGVARVGLRAIDDRLVQVVEASQLLPNSPTIRAPFD
jgi:rare lipoprotein A